MIDFKGIQEFREDLDQQEYFLLPYIYLFANEVLEPVICKDAFFPETEFSSYIRPVYIFNENAPIVCDYAITTFKIGEPQYMGAYFTPVRKFKKKVLSVQSVTSYNSILLLAAAGLELQLHAVSFDVSRSEEIEQIRSKLDSERQDYVHAITNTANEAFDRLKSKVYHDTVDWAINEAALKIEPKIREFEKAIGGLDRKLLERISMRFLPLVIQFLRGYAKGVSNSLDPH